MRNIIMFFMLIASLMLVGCDSNETDINITSTTQYINTTESVKVSSFNGFRLSDTNTVKNEDGSYTVVLNFVKLFN